MREGWIALHRKLLEDVVWLNSSAEQKSILIAVLLLVDHQENEWEWNGKKFKTKPGQTITSIDSIIKACGKGIKSQNVRTALKRFEKLGFLTNESTKTGRLITVLKWDTYQEIKNKHNKDTNNHLTNGSQRPNKDLTPNNNGNNVNNENNIISVPLNDGSFFTPDEKYINQLKDTYKHIDIDSEFKSIVSWCISNPKKQKTPNGVKRFVNSWMLRNNEKNKPKDHPEIFDFLKGIENGN